MSSQKTYTLNLDELDWDPNWPTQRADLAAALEIISRHQAKNGAGLRLLDDWGQNDQGDMWIKMPDWVIELSVHYQALYDSRSEEVMQRVMRVLIPVERVH